MVPTVPAPSKASSDFVNLPETLRRRLAAENILTPADWRRLNRRQRRSIFGITLKHVELIDRAWGQP